MRWYIFDNKWNYNNHFDFCATTAIFEFFLPHCGIMFLLLKLITYLFTTANNILWVFLLKILLHLFWYHVPLIFYHLNINVNRFYANYSQMTPWKCSENFLNCFYILFFWIKSNFTSWYLFIESMISHLLQKFFLINMYFFLIKFDNFSWFIFSL